MRWWSQSTNIEKFLAVILILVACLFAYSLLPGPHFPSDPQEQIVHIDLVDKPDIVPDLPFLKDVAHDGKETVAPQEGIALHE